MFSNKIPKSQLPDKELITIHYHHSIPIEGRKWDQDYYRVISIDPGTNNFAFRIETRPSHSYGDGSNKYFPPKTEILTKTSFKQYTIEKNTGLTYLYSAVNDFLDQFEEWFPLIHMVMIEKQMPMNYKMVRLSQHVIAYFLIKLKNLPLLPSILEVDPKLKTKVLAPGQKMDQREVKRWAIIKAYELAQMRGDTKAIEIIDKAEKSKKDDLSDTLVQLEACFKYLNLPITHEVVPIKLDLDVPAIPSNFNILFDEPVSDNIILSTNVDELNKISLSDIISSTSKNHNNTSTTSTTLTHSPTSKDSKNSPTSKNGVNGDTSSLLLIIE